MTSLAEIPPSSLTPELTRLIKGTVHLSLDDGYNRPMSGRTARSIKRDLILFIGGPTATGKGAVADALADLVEAELVLCDSAKVYRGLGIGANKPSSEQRRRHRYHLLDICDPDERFSAGRYARAAAEALADIRERGKLPVVVGGTFLFATALFDGICQAPPTDPIVADELSAMDETALRNELELVDPEAAERITPHDRQRLIRALAVWRQSGRSLSDWRAATPVPDHGAPLIRYAFLRDRAKLYERIDERARRIFADGILDETEELLARGCPPDCPALEVIGYTQAVDHLFGYLSYDEAVEATARASRRLAKRQLSWLRSDERFRQWTIGAGNDPRTLALELLHSLSS